MSHNKRHYIYIIGSLVVASLIIFGISFFNHPKYSKIHHPILPPIQVNQPPNNGGTNGTPPAKPPVLEQQSFLFPEMKRDWDKADFRTLSEAKGPVEVKEPAKVKEPKAKEPVIEKKNKETNKERNRENSHKEGRHDHKSEH